jgi:GntR family transcriptional regulator, transcriptional repressor for pyruvate dehydrogenase complex
VRFHAAIAAASGNRMLKFLLEGMDGPLHLSRLESIRGHRSRSDGIGELVDRHAEIYRCIANRDAPGAAKMMRSHLIQMRNDLRAAFSSTPANVP